MRLNKYISETGVCSRREADEWIARGRVTINGVRAELGSQVGEDDEVRVDRQLIGAKKKHVYILLNKPVGVTCSTERHIKGNIIDFVGHAERIFDEFGDQFMKICLDRFKETLKEVKP